jgi:hypothetical protein
LDPQHAYEKFDGRLLAEPDVSQAAKVLQQLKVAWQRARSMPTNGGLLLREDNNFGGLQALTGEGAH